MSNTLGDGEQPYDLRHENTTPPVSPAVADFWTQEQTQREIDNEQEPRHFFDPAPMPSRIPGETLIRPVHNDAGEVVGEQRLTIGPPEPITPSRVPPFGAGLNWVANVHGLARPDLVNFDFGAALPYENAPVVSNIELRTIYAHLLETAGRVRAEMRERGMQVDL